MPTVSIAPPVSGLGDLSTESRMIATPWSRLVRGIGLGQYPVDYDPAVAERIRHVFALLADKVSAGHAYTRFSSLLADLVLRAADPAEELTRADAEASLIAITEALRAEQNPYFQLTAACILLDAFAKLGLDRTLLTDGGRDLPGEALAALDRIEPDRIKDENQGRHGDYERLSASTAVFLALGQAGFADRLISPRNHVREALALLDRIPAPFFRGRGGAMLLSVVSLLGHDGLALDDGHDRLAEVLDYLDHADEVNLPPAFPQPLSPAFAKIYPLLTTLNAVAMSGRARYLEHGRDRLAEAKDLMARISPVERTHMSLYYLVALHNLGRLDDQIPDLDAFVEELLGQAARIEPGANYFLNGISYSYLIETAMVTGRTDLLTDELLDRLADCFPDLDRTDEDRVNRPYPMSYALTMLGEVGAADRFFLPRPRYAGAPALDWAIARLSAGARDEPRLYMLDHALINYALRLRGAGAPETELFGHFRFRLAG